MLPPAEMDYSAFDNPRDRLCSFDSKFTPGSIPYESIEIHVPARLNAQEHDQLKDVAMRAYKGFNCRDYGRIDLRSLDGRIYVLDINPNADVSPDTSLALAAEAAGLTYGMVASQLVHLAAARHPLFGTVT
jgi:D-alanine-D-alanine ligase